MPDTSTYAKMRDIISAVRRMRRCTMEALTTELITKASSEDNGFVYYRRNARGTVESNPCNESTIRRHVRFCQELGFLTQESELKLSDATHGVKSKADFNAMLETQVI